MKRILPIVEGDGDLQAVPELLRRIAYEHGCYDLSVCSPHKRGDLPKVQSRFRDFLEIAMLESAPVIWVLDYDCAECTDVLRDTVEWNLKAAEFAGNFPVEFVFMVKEFETLFLADPTTTKLVFSDIPEETSFPKDPESIRDAKGWLSQARPKGSAYKPTAHQKRLTSQVDLKHLRTSSPSYARFEQATLRLLGLAATE